MNEKQKIVDFYKDQDIFITGGLGFMGKVLIEKLLRSCPDLNRLFVLVRGRKNLSAEERLQKMLTSPLFDLLRSQNSSALSKVMPIEGDVSLDKCGINEKDLLTMENVSIVFHSAATTRFKETFSKTIMINTNGTYQVMKLCLENFKYIKVILHMSTTFCNLDQDTVEEKIYPAYADWRKIVEFARKSDDISLEVFRNKYLKLNHNNYTLSKHLAEQVVNDFRTKLPLVVFRPSVVVNTVCEPIPGWADVLSGPLTIMIGIGSGLVRMTYCDENIEVEMVSVDVAIKAMIVAAYKKGLEYNQKENKQSDLKDLNVYNCSTKISSKYMAAVGKEVMEKSPFEKCIWTPSYCSTNNFLYYLINYILFQLFPAFVVDGLLTLFGKKRFLLRLQKTAYRATMAYYPFYGKQYDFDCKQMQAIDDEVQISEFHKFAFLHYKHWDQRRFIADSLKGLQTYYFNYKSDNFIRAKYIAKFLLILDRIVKISFYAFVIKCIINLEIVNCNFGLGV